MENRYGFCESVALSFGCARERARLAGRDRRAPATAAAGGGRCGRRSTISSRQPRPFASAAKAERDRFAESVAIFHASVPA